MAAFSATLRNEVDLDQLLALIGRSAEDHAAEASLALVAPAHPQGNPLTPDRQTSPGRSRGR